MNMNELLNKVKEKIDTNNDGEISANEVLSMNTVTVLLGVICSIIASAAIEYIMNSLSSGDWSDGILLDTVKRVITPLILLFVWRYILKGMDKTNKEKDSTILKLREKQDKLRSKLNKKDLELQQLEGVIKSKNQEIDMIRGFIDNDIGQKLGY